MSGIGVMNSDVHWHRCWGRVIWDKIFRLLRLVNVLSDFMKWSSNVTIQFTVGEGEGTTLSAHIKHHFDFKNILRVQRCLIVKVVQSLMFGRP
jgi:hypothetical protein